MSIVDDILRANDRFADGFQQGIASARPAAALAIVTCMDARIMPEQLLGLGPGDAHVIRNAGGIVTDDVVRSLVISHKLLGTKTFFVINHTGCGMLALDERGLKMQLARETGADTGDVQFHPFHDVETNVRDQVDKIASHPFFASIERVHGFVYEVESGRLRQVA